ncbi:MAG: FAD-binding protein [Caulobacterales bacterium]
MTSASTSDVLIVGSGIACRADGVAWVIFDAQTEEIESWRRAIRSDIPAIEAATIEDLAAQLKLPVDAIIETVSAFNAACLTSGEFKPFQIDHLATKGLEPKKSNWARPIVKFRAYPIIAPNCFTFGGVKVSPDAQVLDRDGKAITGLYAAGETMGVYHQVYAASTSVLRGATFGRIVAQRIADTVSA